MIRKITFVLLAVAASGTASYAQSVDCTAFQHNADGTWSPTRQVIISSADDFPEVTISPGMNIGPDSKFNGIDIYWLLQDLCH